MNGVEMGSKGKEEGSEILHFSDLVTHYAWLKLFQIIFHFWKVVFHNTDTDNKY